MRRPLPARRLLPAILPLLLLAGPALGAGDARGEDWGAPAGPTASRPTRSIGGTGNGCLDGAVALPPEGPGWQAVRLSRNRRWGTPELVRWVEGFAGRTRAAGMGDLWIGDLSQPRGGPMRSGHASHQTGLDVDVWFDLAPKPVLSGASRERIAVASLVLPGGAAVDPARWSPAHAALIRMAASSPGVDRVLVNPAIKRALCAEQPGAPWLRFVRPWRGHDEHMHVRLRCPAGARDCVDLAPPPAGDGCDATLEWWFSAEARRPPTGPAGPPPAMPAACRSVLLAP